MSNNECYGPDCSLHWHRQQAGKVYGSTDVAKRMAVARRLLQGIEALRRKKAMQVYEDRCESPMCWFRPGRTVQDVDKEQGSNYAREVSAMKEFMKREAENRWQLKAAMNKITRKELSDTSDDNDEFIDSMAA